ncbi:MAG: alpha/beta hydrolase [Pseudobacter sp.]|uniref:alpha/beta hydrolase n=1 Tax=Pseudobacter sp. TaxID=2045420 RepID=UPI003F812BE8
MIRKLALTLLCSASLAAMAQTEIPLYQQIPNSIATPNRESSATDQKGIVRISKVSQPTLKVYLPSKEKATGTGIIVVPGGGYSILAIKHEGDDVAKALNEMGIAAFVLKYRLPDDSTMVDPSIGPVQDAQRAIQMVREKAKEYGVKAGHLGILGFSAGGHLASTAGTHFDTHYIEVDRKTNLRPDFQVLIYPVISFTDSLMHKGSRTRLLGEKPSEEKIKAFSNDQRVTAKTPPAFLVHAKNDKTVLIQNSRQFYAACLQHKVPAELYEFEQGGHGFGMINPTSAVKWMDLLQEWLKKNKFLK